MQSVAAGAYADVALDRTLKKYSLSAVDRKLVTELAYGSIRLRNSLDAWIDFLGKVPSQKQPPLLRLLLHLGLYQILKMDKIPSSAAINTTVELAKRSQLRNLAPVVNGLLRSVDRSIRAGKMIPLPDAPAEYFVQKYSLPLWFSEGIIDWFGQPLAKQIAKASNKVPALDLRINRLRSNPIKVQKEFELAGIRSTCIEGVPNGVEVNSGVGDLRMLPGYEGGNWCVQDRSSQKASLLLDPQPGENILDACSAPGSKTTHLAELMGNRGEIWAVDRSQPRLNLVDVNAKRLGVTCVKTLNADSCNLLQLKPEWQRYFHRVLLDAPCSGLGTLARHPDARWRMTPRRIEELVVLQIRLLASMLPLLRPGGTLVYSTCTIHPNENYLQVDRFMSLHPEVRLKSQTQILPHMERGGDGFYIAIFGT
tara:strand:+ start:943 stop:2211 length:1269 start_codon:yes stop_codon:yes gene_type:complete